MHNVKMVHGIRTRDGGKKTFGILQKMLQILLENSKVSLVNYGYILIPITNDRAKRAIIKSLEDASNSHPITIVSYSNGCWATVLAMEDGQHADHLVLINPALRKDYVFPEHIKRVDVYYSPNDFATRLSKMYSTFVNLFPWRESSPHGWGEMGRVGYVGDDVRVHNHNMGRVSHFFYNHWDVAKEIARDIDKLYEGNNYD